ncbi:MAG: hypothetical protein ABI432_19415 [Flavobacteriales bacterium]
MSDPTTSNDPLSPIYPHDPANLQHDELKGGLGSKTNLAVLVVIAVVILAVVLFLGREKPAAEPSAPVATEIK